MGEGDFAVINCDGHVGLASASRFRWPGFELRSFYYCKLITCASLSLEIMELNHKRSHDQKGKQQQCRKVAVLKPSASQGCVIQQTFEHISKWRAFWGLGILSMCDFFVQILRLWNF